MDKNLNKSAYSLFARSKYDNAQEVQNLRCAFLCALSTRARTFFLTLVIAITVLATTGMAGMNVYAETGTVRVATFDQLRVALEDTQGVKKIVVDPQAAADDGDVIYSVENDEDNDAFYIGFDAPLTVSHDITITSADDVDVFFARSDSFRRDQGNPALFNIDRTGNLKLEGLITMTGEEVTTAYNDREFVFSIKSRDGTGDDNDAWNRGQVLKGGFYIQNNGGEYNLGDDVILEDFHTTDDVEGVEPISEKETNSLFGGGKSDEEATEEETVVAPAPKRMMMKSAGAPARNGSTPNYTPNDTTDTKTVATSAQLEAALNDPAVTTIIVDPTGALALDQVQNKDANGNINPQLPNVVGDTFYLPVDKPLTIAQNTSNNRSVTIRTKDGKDAIIARSDLFTPSITNPAIFNVPNGVTLTLDSKITMTGDKVTSAYKNGEGANASSSYDPGKEYKAGSVTFANSNLRLSTEGSDSTNVKMKSTGKEFWLEDGLLVCDHVGVKHYLKGGANANLSVALKGTNTSSTPFVNHVEVRDASTEATITALSANQSYVLYDTSWKKYLKSNGSDGFSHASGLGDAMVFTSGAGSGNTAGQAYAPVEFKYTVENPKWTNNDENNKQVLPGGFFIHSASGGTVIIKDGVTIGNLRTECEFTLDQKAYEKGTSLYTKGFISDAAPIYVGGRSTLTFEGGVISNNEVGYGAKDADSQSHVQNLKNWFNNSVPTNTAGAIIATDEGTTVTISGNATITGNRADAGALIVKDNATVTMNTNMASKAQNAPDAEKLRGISYNTGWHHSGAVLVENGGKFQLDNGSINNNVAWLKGGAVWATEFGTIGLVRWTKYPSQMQHSDEVRANRTGGIFVMNGGELDNNFSFVRAGAVEVESNEVFLYKGTISNNKCKSLGGAIYIEGDSPIYSYTLNIRNGYIHDNTAVPSKADALLDRRLVNNGSLSASDDSENKKYNQDSQGWHKDGDWANYGHKQSGDGGGVWLCSMGGTSVFTSTYDEVTDPAKKAQVYIAGNHASDWNDTPEDNGWGEDFYVSHRHGSALIQNLIGDWYYDGQKPASTNPIDTDVPEGTIIKGPKGMFNNIKEYSGVGGIQIIGNRARNGGGIACNGTVILGAASSVYRYEAEFNIEKEFVGVPEKSVKIQLYYDGNQNKVVDNGDFLIKKEGTLEGESQVYEVELGAGSAAVPTGNEVIYKTSSLTAKANIPAKVIHNGQEVELYKINSRQKAKNGEYVNIVGDNSVTHIDTDNKLHLQKLYEYLNGNGSDNVKLEIDWFIQIVEEGDDYQTTLSGANATATASVGDSIELVNPGSGETIDAGTFSVNFSTVKFGQKLTNEKKAFNVELKKVDDNGNKLKGAKFKYYRAEEDGPNLRPVLTTVKEVEVTDNEGTFTLEGLTNGTYMLFETDAPAGYKRSVDPWFIKVADGKITKIQVMKNRRNGAGAYYDKALSRDSWNLTRDGYIDPVSKKYIGEYTSDPDFKNMVWPAGSDPWMEDQTVDGIKVNDKVYNYAADLKITKKSSDSTATPVEGAKFAFFDVGRESETSDKLVFGNGGVIKQKDSNGDTKDQPIFVVETGTDGNISLSGVINNLVITANTGNVGQGRNKIFDNDDSLWLLMLEIDVPNKYRQKTTPWLINITKDGTVKAYEYNQPYKYDNNKLITQNDNGTWVAHAGQKNTDLTISGFKAPGTPVSVNNGSNNATVTNDGISIEFEKIKKGDSSEKINNAAFTLYYAKEVDNTDGKSAKKYVVDINKGDDGVAKANITSSGEKYIVDIPDASHKYYLLFETYTPSGYSDPILPWGIVVNPNGSTEIWKVQNKAVNELKEKFADEKEDKNIYLYCDTSNYIEKLNSYQLENEPMTVELIKYKSETDYTSAANQLSRARFQLIKLNNTSIEDAKENLTTTRKELVKLTNSNLSGVGDGSRVFILDSQEGDRKLFAAPNNDTASVSKSSVFRTQYPDTNVSLDAMTFYLEEHKVGEKTLYAFRTQDGRYLRAQTGDDPEWSWIRISDRYYSGEYIKWESGLFTCLFNIVDLSHSNGSVIRPYWHGPNNEVKEHQLRVKSDYISGEKYGTNLNSQRGVDIYIEKDETYMTEHPAGSGHYLATGLENGYYQIVETAAPNGYQEVPNDVNHRMVIKVDNGRITRVEGSDPRFALTDSGLQLKLANDELTSIPVKKKWAGTAPSNITSIDVKLYAEKNGTSSLVETKRIYKSDNWSGTFTDLPKYYYDDNRVRQEISYYVTEGALYAGDNAINDHNYTPTYSTDSDGETLVITNNKTDGKVRLTIDKEWSIENDPSAQLPSKLEIEVYNDYEEENTIGSKPVATAEITPDANGNWSVTISEGLPKFGKNDPNRIVKYWVKEKGVEGFTQVSVTDYEMDKDGYVQAQPGDGKPDNPNSSVDGETYYAYSKKNPEVSDGYPSHLEHFITGPDGQTEQVFCLNNKWKEPYEHKGDGEPSNTSKTRYEKYKVDAEELGRLMTPKYGEGIDYNRGRFEPYNELYYKILAALYYGSGSDAAGISKYDGVNSNSDKLAHMTQYAIYEYTDYYAYQDWKSHRYDYRTKDKVETVGSTTYGPRGLIVPPYDGYDYRVISSVRKELNGGKTAYGELMRLIDTCDYDTIDDLGLTFYVYKPIDTTGIAPGNKYYTYQYLIGVESGIVNYHVSLKNERRTDGIVIYKHSSKETATDKIALNGVVFELFEKSDSGTDELGNGEKVIKKGEFTTTGEGVDKGKVNISGLLTGHTYYLREETPAPGYIKLDGVITFTISEDTNAQDIVYWNSNVSDTELKLKVGANITTPPVLRVSNEPIYNLPHSGGIGTYWFMILGMGMMTFAVTTLIIRKKGLRKL